MSANGVSLHLEHLIHLQPPNLHVTSKFQLVDLLKNEFGFGWLGVGDVDRIAGRGCSQSQFGSQRGGRQVLAAAREVAFAVAEGGFDDQRSDRKLGRRGFGKLLQCAPQRWVALGISAEGPPAVTVSPAARGTYRKNGDCAEGTQLKSGQTMLLKTCACSAAMVAAGACTCTGWLRSEDTASSISGNAAM